ncbi:MAG: hypothetical protein R6V04_16055, partial [bacterium]
GYSIMYILNEGFKVFDMTIPFSTNNLRRLEDFVGWGTITLGSVSPTNYSPVSVGITRIRFPEGTVFPDTEDQASWGTTWENSFPITIGFLNARWSKSNINE